MHYIPMCPDSYVNLPRSGGVAYAAQESWVQNETIKVRNLPECMFRFLKCPVQDNILFGSPFDSERYNKGKSSIYVI